MFTSTSTPTQFHEYMLKRIASRIQDDGLKEEFREVAQQEKIGSYDLDELFDSVDDRDIRVALLLDEFQNIGNNSNFELDFLYGLRSLAIHHNLALITASRGDLVGMSHADAIRSSPWFNIFSTVVLPPFSRGDVDEMLQKYMEGTEILFTDAEVKYVLSLTGTLPIFLQMAFSFLFEAYQREPDEAHRLAFVAERFQETASSRLESYWQNSSEREKTVLALLALMASQQNGQASYWKLDQLESLYVSAGGALDELVGRGLLVRSHDRYALASTSVYQWIAEDLTNPAAGEDNKLQQGYEDRLKVSLPERDASRVVDWLRTTNTKYKSLFGRWMCDPRTSEKVFELLTSSNLPFQNRGAASIPVEALATSMKAPEAELQVRDVIEGRAEIAGLAEKQPQQLRAEESLVSIMFTDLEGSTELLNRLGDEANQELLRVHNSIIRELMYRYGGTEVKSMGDGFMVVFPKAKDAANCAIDAQRRLQEHNMEHPNRQLRVRMGLNSGEPIREEEDFFGNSVVLAARVMSHASGGQIFISDPFRKMLEDAGDFQCVDRSWKRLKGFAIRQHIHEIIWDAGT